MKLAFSSTGPTLDSRIDPRFGRCECFLVVDPETEAIQVLDKEATALGGGAGIRAAQMIADVGVDVVITGRLGPNAAQVLNSAGLRTYLGVSGAIREPLDFYAQGKLPDAPGKEAKPSLTPGMGGVGMGRGRGRGMGRGGRGGRGMGGG